MIRKLLVVLASCVASALATVPQIKLCSHADCPSVSRVGMGTLHLGDWISGISKPEEINAWIKEALSLGITLFDLADVSLPKNLNPL